MIIHKQLDADRILLNNNYFKTETNAGIIF